MGCKPTFQKPQPGQKFSWEMLYHRCASDFGRATSAFDCYERELSMLRSALTAATKALDVSKAEVVTLHKENGKLSTENAQLAAKLDACASLTQTLKAESAKVGASMVPFKIEWTPIVAALLAGSVGGYVVGRRTK